MTISNASSAVFSPGQDAGAAAGLTTEQAAARLAEFGPNVLPEAQAPSLLAVFLRQFLSPLIYILLAAALVSLALSDVKDALFIGVVLLTTDVIDKSFLKGSAIFSSRARITAWRRAGSEVKALPRSLYRRASFAASVRAFFGPRGFQPATKRA